MSRDISWITEIKNNTNQDYIIWCRDSDNEGEFHTNQGKEVGKNDGGKRVTIKAGAHLYASGCGIPDGNHENNLPRCRIICLKSEAVGHSGDPEHGLRINRLQAPPDENGNKRDMLVYRNHHTTKEIATVMFPQGVEQNLIMRIDDDGIFIDVKESYESSEWKAYLVGKQIEDVFTKLLPDLAGVLIEAAGKAVKYM